MCLFYFRPRDVVQLVECLLSIWEVPGSIPSNVNLSRAVHLHSVLRGWRQGEQKVVIIIGYVVSSRPAWGNCLKTKYNILVHLVHVPR